MKIQWASPNIQEEEKTAVSQVFKSNKQLPAEYQELAELLAELDEPELAEEASRKAHELRPMPPRRPGWFPFGPLGGRRHAAPPHAPSAVAP